MTTRRLLATAALALAGTFGFATAQAHDGGVQWSVTIGAPVYSQPAPFYAPPVVVYRSPAPAWVQPAPVWVQPAPVYSRGGYYGSTRWDRDGDGIPNRYDRVYNPRWDRNANGVADWREGRHGWRDGHREGGHRDDGRGWQGR